MNRLASALLVLTAVASVSADTVVSMTFLFEGRNVYAPTIMKDGVYKMWYGGWETDADFPNDKIYYRTSDDNTKWSGPITVLTPTQLRASIVHLNDPSVTKHFNTTNGIWQYTMFYTVCLSPCRKAGNSEDSQIWSAVSSDGVSWLFHQPLLTGSLGASEPSAVIVAPQSDGTFWRVYYVDRLDADKVKVANVGGNRNVLSTQVVYKHPVDQSITSAEVRRFNGKWHLFFNAHFHDHLNICKTESFSDLSWPSTFETLIENTGSRFCATVTPGVLPAGGAAYDLYFGLTPRPGGGGCDLTQQRSIQRWRWAD